MDFNFEEANKPDFKPRFLSEYSMGEYDFKRINDTLVKVDFFSSLVNSTHLPSLELMQNYFANLVNLYDNFRPIMSIPSVVNEIDSMIKESTKMKRLWERSIKNGTALNEYTILKFVDALNETKRKLYYIKQVIGLGIIIRKNLSTKEKIKMGVRGDTSLKNLPEA